MDDNWNSVDSILSQLTEELTQLQQICARSPEDVDRFAKCKNLVNQLRSAKNPISNTIIITGDVDFDDDNNKEAKFGSTDDTLAGLEQESIRSMSSVRSQSKSIDLSSLRKSPTIVRINAKHNIYCSIFGETKTKWIFQNMVNSKLYVIINLVLLMGINVLAIILGGSWQWFLASGVMILLFAGTYILSLNYDIIRLVLRTFDFWFKISNTILPMVYMALTYSNTVAKVISIIALQFMCYLIFMIDAAFWSYKLKFYMMLSFMVLFLLIAVYDTFTAYDYDIIILRDASVAGDITLSLKSFYISGLTSIALLTMKPALAIRRAMKEKEQEKKLHEKPNDKSSNKGATNQSKRYDRLVKSTTVNNRPYFRWKNTQILGK